MPSEKTKSSKRRVPKTALGKHMKKLGFTNRYAVYLLLLLVAGLVGGFILAYLSIRAQYVGALACWTVVFTPIGTGVTIVLGKTVDKSKAENTGGNGDGIKYALAMMSGAQDAADEGVDDFPESPQI